MHTQKSRHPFIYTNPKLSFALFSLVFIHHTNKTAVKSNTIDNNRTTTGDIHRI